MNCQICNKDHTKKNTGPLTECELKEYLKGGAKSVSSQKGEYVFGSGRRFQLKEAK